MFGPTGLMGREVVGRGEVILNVEDSAKYH